MSDLISRQDAITEIRKYFVKEIIKTPHALNEDGYDVYTDMAKVNSLLNYNKELNRRIKALPSADRPTGECRTCGRNADNGGVHEDGRTKCPIQEHYALLLDGYCHLYEPYDCGAKMLGEDGEA